MRGELAIKWFGHAEHEPGLKVERGWLCLSRASRRGGPLRPEPQSLTRRVCTRAQVSLSDEQDKRNPTDAISAIYSHLRNHAMANDVADVEYAEALKMITVKGHTQASLNACLEEYEALNVWQLDANKNITFVS